MSATTMYQIACRSRLGEATDSGGSLASSSTLTAIHSTSSPPHNWTYGTVSNWAATEVSADPQRHCGAGAADDSDPPLARRERADGHRDHQRVVARQQKIDQDNREAAQQEVHGTRPVQALRAPEVALRHPHVFQDLRPQRFRRFELALVADPPQELHADPPRRLALQRIQQEGLDRKLVAGAERGTVTDVGDRIPMARLLQVVRAGDVHPACRNQLFRRARG